MAEEVANVARRINSTVEEGKDSLGKIQKRLWKMDEWVTFGKNESNFSAIS